MVKRFTEAAVIIICAVCAYWLAVIIHEACYLCMGLLSGSSFVSFRIGSFLLTKDHGKLNVTKMRLPGTLGQCIMMPPENDDPGIMEGVLYHAGGGMFNLITAVITFAAYLFSDNRYVSAFLIMLGGISFGFALLNLIPYKINVPNDGYNIRLLIHNKADRKAIHQILRIEGYTDRSPSEIPLKEYEYENGGEYSRVMKMLKAEYYPDAGDFKTAEQMFRECSRKDNSGMVYYRLEAQKELLCCLLIRKAEENEINAYMDEELDKYLHDKNNISINIHRVLYTYYHLFTKEETKAQNEYETAMRMIEKQPESSEAKMEKRLLETAKAI